MKKKQPAKFLLKRLLLMPLGLLAYAVTRYASKNPSWAETVYSQSLYPKITAVVSFLPARLSFSVYEWLVALLLILALSYFSYTLYQLGKNKGIRGLIFYRFLVNLMVTCSLIYFLFTLTCGINYYRYSFIDYTTYTAVKTDQEDLENLVSDLAQHLALTKNNLSTNKAAALKDFSFDAHASTALTALENLAQEYPILDHVTYTKPKALLSSALFSKAGIAGLFFPFTFESNINIKMPDVVIPATMTHELAHQAGFMREDEANFIAYLACLKADDENFRYSGYFLAYTQGLNALKKMAPEKAKASQDNLAPAVAADFSQYQTYLHSQKGLIQTSSTKLNDTYLKLNQQTHGVATYGRMVELLLLEYKHKSS